MCTILKRKMYASNKMAIFHEEGLAGNRTFIGKEELLRSRGVQVELFHREECINLMRRFIDENRNCGMRIPAEPDPEHNS